MIITNMEVAMLRRELEAERTRRKALENDWHRMRDVERQWERFGKLTVFAVSAAMLIAAAAVIGGA